MPFSAIIRAVVKLTALNALHFGHISNHRDSKERPFECYSNSSRLELRRLSHLLHLHPALKASPYSLVGQPAGVAVVEAIGEGGLQLTWRRHARRVLCAHPLGISEGQAVAVMRGPVVEHNTWSGEMKHVITSKEAAPEINHMDL